VITDVTPADLLLLPGAPHHEGIPVTHYPDSASVNRVPLDRGVLPGDVILAVNFESMQGKVCVN
jgi:hypothetical protein